MLYVGYPIDWLVGSRGYQDQKLFSGSFFYPPKYIFTEKNFLPLSPLYNYLPSFTLSKGKKQKTKNKKHSTIQKKIIWKKSLNGTRDHFFLSTTYVTMDNTTQWLSGGACWWSRLISRINVVFFFPLLWKGDRVIKKTFFFNGKGECYPPFLKLSRVVDGTDDWQITRKAFLCLSGLCPFPKEIGTRITCQTCFGGLLFSFQPFKTASVRRSKKNKNERRKTRVVVFLVGTV